MFSGKQETGKEEPACRQQMLRLAIGTYERAPFTLILIETAEEND
jgi:hypothetical protein